MFVDEAMIWPNCWFLVMSFYVVWYDFINLVISISSTHSSEVICMYVYTCLALPDLSDLNCRAVGQQEHHYFRNGKSCHQVTRPHHQPLKPGDIPGIHHHIPSYTHLWIQVQPNQHIPSYIWWYTSSNPTIICIYPRVHTLPQQKYITRANGDTLGTLKTWGILCSTCLLPKGIEHVLSRTSLFHIKSRSKSVFLSFGMQVGSPIRSFTHGSQSLWLPPYTCCYDSRYLTWGCSCPTHTTPIDSWPSSFWQPWLPEE